MCYVLCIKVSIKVVLVQCTDSKTTILLAHIEIGNVHTLVIPNTGTCMMLLLRVEIMLEEALERYQLSSD